MMAHTLGPWEAKPENDYVPAQIWADGRQLAEVYGESREQRAGNACLMAAAPELLEAARATLKLWEDWQNTPFARLDITWVGEPPAVKLARAAIEKYEARAA